MPTLILALALLQGGAATADGFSTTYWERKCPACTEAYPVRYAIGARPGWPRMFTAGTNEVELCARVATAMQGMGKWPRRLSWIPQTAGIALHAIWAGRNFSGESFPSNHQPLASSHRGFYGRR